MRDSTLFVRLILVASLLPLAMAMGQDQTATVNESLLPTGRTITAAGESISFHGRPVDLQINGSYLLAKDRNALRVIDASSFELIQSISSPGGASMFGLALDAEGNAYFTNSKNGLHVFRKTGDPEEPFQLDRTIQLPSDSFPCGVTINGKSNQALVCLSKKNSVAVVDLNSNTVVRQIEVGVAPFDIRSTPVDGRYVVSNMGGRRPGNDDATATSAGTKTVVDSRGVASTGTVSVLDIHADPPVLRHVEVGRHPTSLLSRGSVPIVCNTNDDSISLLEKTGPRTLQIKPDEKLPFGSMPCEIVYSESHQLWLVALAGNNAVAVLSGDSMKIVGLIPTGWYPVALELDSEYLYIANTKGDGSRAKRRDEVKGRNSHDHLGTVQRVALSEVADAKQLAKWTAQVKTNSRIPQILRAIGPKSVNPDVSEAPVPNKLGEPSLFKHVIYVIKENRTFDQVFGDLKEARGEPALCTFPEKITPNHHALARRFGILDNYYCNGVLSADGHSWATEGNVTPYLERSFGGFARSYTFGNDPITYSSSGFIWDQFLDAGLSFRNYGEMDYAKPPAGMKYQEIWKAYQEGQPIEFSQSIGIDRLRKYSCRDYPGWNMVIPDVLRVDRFLKEFQEFEQNEGLPNLSIVYLPQDHLGGGVTSRAHMADNDLAIGKLVEAVSKSRYWKDTVIFINEDDPQNGFDHIDGHRSLCLVVSAYSKPGVNHNFYNQTSVVRTMLHIFGLPPMNQQDASAPLMKECFTPVANLRPYQAIDPLIPLNETAQPKEQQTAIEQHWRKILASVPIERTGMKTEKDEDNLNRFIWHESRGWDTPYPDQWSGPHGRGLKSLGLTLDPNHQED